MVRVSIRSWPPFPFIPTLIGLQAFDLVSSRVWWEAATNIGCCYETIEEMKEAVMKVIDTLTQEDFNGAFQKLLEWYNKCIAAGGDYFKGD